MVDDLSVRQTTDGFVMVERRNSDGSRAFISVSPTNGKLKVETPSVQVSSVTLVFLQPFILSLIGQCQSWRGVSLLPAVRSEETSLQREQRRLRCEELWSECGL